MWNAASNYQNIQLKSIPIDMKHKFELHCHCSIPVYSTSRRDPLTACQLLCGNYQKKNIRKCHFSLTLQPINFFETVPSLFVYEVKETGEVFKSFHINPVKAVMELYGMLPMIYQQIRVDVLFVDEPSQQDCYDYIGKVDYCNLLVLFLNTINQLAKKVDLEHLPSTWKEKINRFFGDACMELNNHVQLNKCKEKYSFGFIKQSLVDFVQCQV